MGSGRSDYPEYQRESAGEITKKFLKPDDDVNFQRPNRISKHLPIFTIAVLKTGRSIFQICRDFRIFECGYLPNAVPNKTADMVVLQVKGRDLPAVQ